MQKKIEQIKTNKNPNLNEKGLERAKKWAEIF